MNRDGAGNLASLVDKGLPCLQGDNDVSSTLEYLDLETDTFTQFKRLFVGIEELILDNPERTKDGRTSRSLITILGSSGLINSISLELTNFYHPMAISSVWRYGSRILEPTSVTHWLAYETGKDSEEFSGVTMSFAKIREAMDSIPK